MSAGESRKDELAVRALSHLSDPQLPEGMAARIAAKAVAAPQIGTLDPVRAPAPARHAIVDPPPHRSKRRAGMRRRSYVAAGAFAGAAAAAVLAAVSTGALVGTSGGRDGQPAIAEKVEDRALPPVERETPRLAEIAPEAAKPRKKSGGVRPIVGSEIPRPDAEASVFAEPVPEEMAAQNPLSGQTAVERERLAQTGPQSVPTAPPNSGGISAPVYGPPSPSGLGIAGTVTGPMPLPGEGDRGGRASRGGSAGAPPAGFPGSPAPRGPGPRL